MHPNLNLCPKCEHASYCVLTHNQTFVFECSDFDEKRNQTNMPTQPLVTNVKIEQQELVTV